MKNLQHLHLNIVCGDIMVNVLIFIILFFTVLTIGVVVFYYILQHYLSYWIGY